ncbi:MAG: hypothetical protein KIH08_13745 [Candidatus Freyarchaeota archaeon]|nr:hypothetical protein [Candidatus Jordarchaeia archaeon]
MSEEGKTIKKVTEEDKLKITEAFKKLTEEPSDFRQPIADIAQKNPQPVAVENKKEETGPQTESPIDTYRKTLKNNNISEEEAVDILIKIYYQGSYSKKYKIVGKTFVFQVAPPSYSSIKFKILTEESPTYRQHEIAINSELNMAACLKEADGITFRDDPPEESFMKKLSYIRGLNEYVKTSLFKKFIEFENTIFTVTQTPGVDDFFEVKRSQNT